MAGPVGAAGYLSSLPPERRVPDATEEIRHVIFTGNVGAPGSPAGVIEIPRGD